MPETIREPKAGPLTGLKVLDLSRFLSGPYCALVLSALGADVVKVEKSGSGDESRRLGKKVGPSSSYNLAFNYGKRSVTVDFRDPSGQETLRRLAAKADIVVENFRPGTMEAMGCSYETLSTLNPGLVLASISGYGEDGPESAKPCFDGIAQARAGLMGITGQAGGAPTLCGPFVADYGSSLYTVISILSAIHARNATGRGAHVEVSLIESALSMMATILVDQQLDPGVTVRHGNRDRYAVPGNLFTAQDGRHIYLVTATDTQFRKLIQAAGLEETLGGEDFVTNASRVAQTEFVERAIGDWIATLPAAEVVSILAQAAIPAEIVLRPNELLRDPLISRQLINLDIGNGETLAIQRVPNGSSESYKNAKLELPVLGAHTQEVLDEWLGSSK